MPITEAQREQRKKHLGSSDMAAVLGVDPFRSASDVYFDKLYDKTDPPNEAMILGNRFEPGVLDWAENEGGLGKILRNQYRRAVGLPIGANIDGIRIEDGVPVEVKTVGLLGPVREDWGDFGTGDVPARVIVQAHVHMLCQEANEAHVAAMIGGRGIGLYRLTLNADLIGIITNAAVEFWRHVETETPPEGEPPRMDTLKRIIRVPNKIVPVQARLVTDWESAKAAAEAANDAEESAKAALAAALGDAEAGDIGDGRLVTYYRQTRKSYVVGESTFPVLRIKKPKPAKEKV